MLILVWYKCFQLSSVICYPVLACQPTSQQLEIHLSLSTLGFNSCYSVALRMSASVCLLVSWSSDFVQNEIWDVLTNIDSPWNYIYTIMNRITGDPRWVPSSSHIFQVFGQHSHTTAGPLTVKCQIKEWCQFVIGHLPSTAWFYRLWYVYHWRYTRSR